MISGLAGEEIPPQQDAAWKLKYHPGDRGLDSFLLQFKFRPYPQSDPDSIVTINGFLRGFGVEQDMYLFNAGHPIKRGIQGLPDTIDIGDIRVNNSREFFGVIENRGNLAFGSSSQSFTSIENISAGLSITQPLLSSGNHIYPAETDTFWLKCRPHDRGVFIAKYRLKSDISERGIFGVPPDARNVDIIIKGRGVEPELTVANDTLDFGNVVLNPPFCLPERDTVINIHNSGNFPLIINDVRITPAGAQFYVDKNEALIEPNTSESFTFTFSSRETGSFTADVTFISNELPEDKNKMFLSASGVQAEQAVVNMPVIRSKPGMIVDIPIIIDKSKITLASNFRDTITFDETLLRFDDTNPESTASESAKIFAHADNEEGTLALLIEMPVDEHFPVNDTLIKLRFRTYLGQRVSYPLSFSSPKFGNGKCEQVLNLSATNGLFALDSVCGLEVKAHERTESSFSLNLPYPNPAENNSFIEYETAFKTKVNIYIYNSYGEKVKSIVENELPAGEYRSGFSTASLSPGIYYCTMQAGIYKKTVKFIVAR